MLILGIETSCDETAAAIVEDGRRVIAEIVASQAAVHAQFGGVVPEVASRQHIQLLIPVIEEVMRQAAVDWSDLSAIAVTAGPGLAGSLLVGVNVAKALALAQKLPLIPVNHLAGHIYAGWLYDEVPTPEPRFPLLCLIVSGAHSDLVLMSGHWQFQRIGRTRDDAAGEAFDKVARLLGLGYPGGPAIQRAAAAGSPDAIPFPRSSVPGRYDVSFSGLKTAMRRLIARYPAGEAPVADLAASFQAAVAEVLTTNALRAAAEHDVAELLVCGGVAANLELRRQLGARSPVPVRWPPVRWCTDNGAMIAAAGYFASRAGVRADFSLDADPALTLGTERPEERDALGTH
ncbi:MAG: tRNA (adenosine(37)-N6)-threonylcarbamoyltransferase complex transferase subunit TsaD [Chloroflexota bacterium]|nr:tRNA (adenosine(37)-N6)-threonylcarbamoyltransferase complex transferase subunit TsaD [Dehalococcoidia bacterium]MDW8254228.1 tRNA (adenosine(37)-N6)-threonylcarbamoyltransferase complex transferase subunit TsaD [Chloroflexota bacterium]